MPKKIRPPAKQREATDLPYVQISMELLRSAPIKHRNDPDDGKLTPFTFAVAVGLLTAAQAKLGHSNHTAAFEAGGKRIEYERHLRDDFKEDWQEAKQARKRGQRRPSPTYVSSYSWEPEHKPDRLGEALSKAGKHGYKDRRSELAKAIPEAINICLTDYAILRCAGLNVNSRAMRRLDASLDRLTRPLGKFPALIREMRGKRFEIDTSYFAPPFAPLPKPLPVRSAAALALYLLVHGLRTHPTNRESMAFTKLCDLLGISRDNGVASAQRDLYAAEDIVNAHMAALPVRKLHRAKAPVPKSFVIKRVGDGNHVRLVAIRYEKNDDGELILPRERIPRVRVSAAERERDQRRIEDREPEEQRGIAEFERWRLEKTEDDARRSREISERRRRQQLEEQDQLAS